MTNMCETKLNLLPVPTFGWLGVNAAERDAEKYETEVYEVSAAEGERRSAHIWLDTESIAEVIVNAERGSYVKVVLVVDVKGEVFPRVTAEVAEGAEFDLVLLYLGGDAVSETVTRLSGRKAVFNAEIGYLLDSGDSLDLNLITEHTGRKTVSRINAGGVLKGTARKTFKGTIDFKNGASGAKGSEKEEVLLLSDKAVNKTVPLILCAEDDVEGSHGASIGRIDEREVFYMQTRGIPEEKICELAALGKLRQILSRIGDEDTVSRINKRLGRGEEDE